MDQDQEFAAMREMYRLLKPFDRDAQERIGSYVGALLAAEHSKEDQQNMIPPTAAASLNRALGSLG